MLVLKMGTCSKVINILRNNLSIKEFAFFYMWFHLQEMIGEERKLCPAEPIQSRNAKLSNLLTTLVHHMCSETHLSISDITTFYLISDNTPSPSRYYSMVVFDEHICLIIAKLTVYKFNLDQSWHLH